MELANQEDTSVFVNNVLQTQTEAFRQQVYNTALSWLQTLSTLRQPMYCKHFMHRQWDLNGNAWTVLDVSSGYRYWYKCCLFNIFLEYMTFTVTLNAIVLKCLYHSTPELAQYCVVRKIYHKENVQTFWTSNFVVVVYDNYSKRYCWHGTIARTDIWTCQIYRRQTD